jgi:hypothetical protein
VSEIKQNEAMDEPTLNEAAVSVVQVLLQQSDTERARISNTLHDELGGLLVAAKMDLSYLENTLGSQDSGVRARFTQVREHLDAAIALERRLVEELQPGMLLHIGLFAALRWHVEHHSQPRVRLQVPESETSLPIAARIALYRALQDALESSSGEFEVIAGVSEDLLHIQAGPFQPGAIDAARRLIILHRVRAVGGWAKFAEGPRDCKHLLIEFRVSAPSS